MTWTPSNYPPDWDQRVQRIRDRANNACEFPGCGAKEGELQIRGKKKIDVKGRMRTKIEPYPNEIAARLDGCYETYTMRVNLSIAHLDHDETNWNVTDDRLLAACQLHHIRYDAKEKVKRTIKTAISKSAESFRKLQMIKTETQTNQTKTRNDENKRQRDPECRQHYSSDRTTPDAKTTGT